MKATKTLIMGICLSLYLIATTQGANGKICGVDFGGMVLTEQGKVYSWGLNSQGRAGMGNTDPCPTAQRTVNLPEGCIDISGYYTCLALDADGALWIWGNNVYGSMGLGEAGDSISYLSSPTLFSDYVPNILPPLKKVSAGNFHGLGIDESGTVWSWGCGWYGQLGHGTFEGPGALPAPITTLTDIIDICAGDQSSLALKSDGTVWAWGYNDVGQLGDGTVFANPAARQIVGLSDVAAISYNRKTMLALTHSGEVYAWGDNSYGQCGIGYYTPSVSPPRKIEGIPDMVSIAAGLNHSLALSSNGEVWSWGYNSMGQLGYSDILYGWSPTKITTLEKPVEYITIFNESSYAILNDGSVASWGNRAGYALGDGEENGSVFAPQIISDLNLSGGNPTPEDTLNVFVNILEGGSYARFDGTDVNFGDMILDESNKYIISDDLDFQMFAANAPWHVRIGFVDAEGLTSSGGDVIQMKYWRPDFGPDPSTYSDYPDPDVDADWWWVKKEAPETQKAKVCWRWLSNISSGDGEVTDMVAWHKDSPFNPQMGDPTVDPAAYESVKSGQVHIGLEASEITAGTYNGILKVNFVLE